jgi:hypothetical protein
MPHPCCALSDRRDTVAVSISRESPGADQLGLLRADERIRTGHTEPPHRKASSLYRMPTRRLTPCETSRVACRSEASLVGSPLLPVVNLHTQLETRPAVRGSAIVKTDTTLLVGQANVEVRLREDA